MSKYIRVFFQSKYYFFVGLYTFLISLNFFDFLPPQDLPPGSDHPARVIFDYKTEIFTELFLLSGLFILISIVIALSKFFLFKKK